MLGVGIQEATAEQIRIFPNPASDYIAVQVKETEIYSIEITSMNGQIIQRLNARGPTCQIDLSSLGKGVYIITVRSRDQVWTEKIIKL
ncbi:MAG: T9SS type A sorting domain-containing protein [Planctomycetota bacterium]